MKTNSSRKNLLVRISLILFLSVLLIPNYSFAASKTFIREYTYRASDFDSKISSRTIALEQVKRLLLEEVGAYLMSETIVSDFQLTKDKITMLTGGIVQTEILAEKWDGQTYYLKARIAADPQEVTKYLTTLKENSQKNRELEEMKNKVDDSLKKIKQLQEELAAGKQQGSTQNEYAKAVAELKAKEWLDKGLALMNEEKYPEALSAFNQAAANAPANSWAYINKGWAQNTLGDYHQALQSYDKAAELDPANPYIYVNRGITYNSLGDYRQALADEEKAIKLNPNIYWAYIGRARSYLGIGNYNQALVDLNKALQLEPDNPFGYSTRVWAHNALGNNRQALEDLNKSINLAPKYSWMHWNAAVFYALTGEKKKALTALGIAIRLNSTMKQMAKAEKNLQSLWNDADFKKLVD